MFTNNLTYEYMYQYVLLCIIYLYWPIHLIGSFKLQNYFKQIYPEKFKKSILNFSSNYV